MVKSIHHSGFVDLELFKVLGRHVSGRNIPPLVGH